MSRRAWLLWFGGAASFPIGASLVPGDAVAVPRILDGGTGLTVWLVWAAGFVAMSYAMLALHGTRLRVLVAAQAFAGLAFVGAHAMPSIDAYAYLGYGELFLRGLDPWRPGTIAALDEVSRNFITAWSASPPASRYGPGFVLAEAAIEKAIGPMAIVPLLLVQRLVSLAAAVAITALVRGPSVRYWALNPFVAYYFVLQAHNDVLFLLLLSVAARVRVPLLAGLAIGLAGSVKVVAIGALAFAKPKTLGGASMLGVGAAIGIGAAYLWVPQAFASDGFVAQTSVVGYSLRYVVDEAARMVVMPSVAGAFALGVVVVVVAAIVLSLRWTRRDASTLATLLAILALPVFWPWYLGWALLASVASSHRATLRAVLGVCAASFVFELPQIWTAASELPVTILFFAIAAAVFVRSGFVRRSFGTPGSRGTLVARALERGRLAAD